MCTQTPLSRLQTLGETETDVDDNLPCLTVEAPEEDEETQQELLDSDDILRLTRLLPLRWVYRNHIWYRLLARSYFENSTRTNSARRSAPVLTRGSVPIAIDADDFLCRTSEAKHRIVVPHNLKQRVLYLSHYPKVAGHPGGRKLYKTLSRHFYWLFQESDCYATVSNCTECA